MRLDKYDKCALDRGRPLWMEALWLLLEALFVKSWIPGSRHRIILLRVFGARIGSGVTIKPGLRVKFPWRLKIGNHSWIGEGVWIDNLASVTIGDHCCLSQDVYLCTGSHNWAIESFDLIAKPIVISDHVWLCARSMVGPGVTVNDGAVLTLGSAATKDLLKGYIYQGVPAQPVRSRIMEVPRKDERSW